MSHFTINLTQIGGAYQQGDWKLVDSIYSSARQRISQGGSIFLQRDVPNGPSIMVRKFEQSEELEEWIRHMEEEYCLAEPY